MRAGPGKPIEAAYSRRPATVRAGAGAFCTRGVGFVAIVWHIRARCLWHFRRPLGRRKGSSPLLITLACVRARKNHLVTSKTY